MSTTKKLHLTIEGALLLLLALYISSCHSFASVNVAYAPHPTTSALSLGQQNRLRNALAATRSSVNTNSINSSKDKKKKTKKIEYQQRKQEWLDRYGSVEALQATFGSTKGDLSPEQTRRLYHTLLPRSLLGLYEMGLMNPQELAPLAYEARIAAKLYARQRCVWYARVATQLFDQYRHVRDKGRLQRLDKTSPTWAEIWSKYEAQIVQEECQKALKENDSNEEDCKKATKKRLKKDDKDLTLRIYLRILEKSTATNKAFDQLFLKNNDIDDPNEVTELENLQQMGQQLDEDVKTILLGPKDSAKALKKAAKLEVQQAKEERKAQEKEEKRQRKLEKKRQKQLEQQTEEEQEAMEKQYKLEQKEREKRLKALLKNTPQGIDMADDGLTEGESDSEDEDDSTSTTSEPPRTANQQRWHILKIMAGTRKKFRVLGETGKLKSSSD